MLDGFRLVNTVPSAEPTEAEICFAPRSCCAAQIRDCTTAMAIVDHS